MGRDDLTELMTTLRLAIARLGDTAVVEERTLRRALALLWSAHDELELLLRSPLPARPPAAA